MERHIEHHEAAEAPLEGDEPPAMQAGNARASGASPATGRVIDLSPAGKGNYVARRSRIVEAIWIVIESSVINNKLVPSSALRVALLRLFCAKIGIGCR